MDNTLTSVPAAVAQRTGWPVAAQLIDTLTRRDLAGLAACFETDVRMRAVTPRAVLDLSGPQAVSAKFEEWFGGTDGFEVQDCSVGMVGSRQYVRWLVRMWPPADPGGSRVVEQHAFLRGTDRVEALDLLCSGFHLEHGQTGGVL